MIFQPGVILPTFESIFSALSKTIIRIIIGIVIFLAGFVIGKLVERVTYKLLKEIEINTIIKNSTGLKLNADH